MRAIGGNEVQRDTASGPRQPLRDRFAHIAQRALGPVADHRRTKCGMGWPLEMDVLGQFCGGQCLPNRVIADIGDLAQAVEKAERLKHAGIVADADIGVPRLRLFWGSSGR